MKVVILGGGFAGFKMARALNNHPAFEITLIDRFNYHQFQPLFYQVATAGLDASNISFPLRKAFQKSRNVRIRITEILAVDPQLQVVATDTGDYPYDILVIATGADTNFFGNQKMSELAFPMKSTGEALQIRHRLIQNLEDALVAKNEADLLALMTIVIVGGGPTGVELSGSLGEMKKYILPKDYPELDFTKMKIYLLEGTPNTLGAMSEKSQQQSLKYLQELGVNVLTNTILKEYDGRKVLLSTGETMEAATVIWAAGIKGNVPKGIDPSLLVRNRIKVDRYNKVEGFSNMYAIGDIAFMTTPKYANGHPQLANVAINQGKTLARNLKRMVKGRPLEEYEYHDKGSMATVGRYRAVVDIPRPKLHFGGALAWFIWMALHLVLLLGGKNRMQVLINWIYKYFTYDQSLRLLFKEFYKPRKA